MKEYLQEIIRPLVEHSREVQVSAVEGQKTSILEMRCNARDVGRVIGKNGKTINAIRTLLDAAARRNNRQAVMEVVE